MLIQRIACPECRRLHTITGLLGCMKKVRRPTTIRYSPKEVERLRTEVMLLKWQVEILSKNTKPQPSPVATLDKAMVLNLIRLCHPDRHGGSELSNQVTAALLKLR